MRHAAACVIVLVAGCGGSTGEPSPDVVDDPAFDVSAVRASFREECEAPIVLDEDFCTQVVIGSMAADGDILHVPTGLNPSARDRAQAICDLVARAHFDGEGRDLGYRYVVILDRDGGNAAACTVEQ